MSQLLIGLAGRAGCGKTTVAEHLKNHRGFAEYSFAGPLKAMLCNLLMVSHEQLEQMKRQGSPILPAWMADDTGRTMPSVRQALQTLGTEWGRECLHPDIWLLFATQRLDWLASEYHFQGVVISDVRFDNEAAFIRRRGGFLIHIDRPHTDPATPAHASEQAVGRAPGDFHITNDADVATLLHSVDAVLAAVNARRAA